MRLTLHLATGNAHKARELAALARLYPVAWPNGATAELDLVVPTVAPQVAEDTGTFAGNARKKALALRNSLEPGSWVLADDSGLAVEALDGGPGVESAYFAGPKADWTANLSKLVEVMRPVSEGKRQAYFYCVLLLVGPGGVEQFFEGRCAGKLARIPSGAGGFGYDPLFIPEGETCTYAELGEAAKNRISHRARAWLGLAEWLGRWTAA